MHRWTIRGIDPDVIDMVHEVAASSDMTIGEVVNAAIAEWYEALPVGDDDQDSEINEPEQPLAPKRGPVVWFLHDPVFEEVSELPPGIRVPDTNRPLGSHRLATRT
jgi:hypothetical protein